MPKSSQPHQIPVHNNIMESPKPSRALYKINIITWFPAFGFLLPAGLFTTVIPPLGIIPLFFSLCNGIVHLRQRKDESKSLRFLTHPIWDLLIFLIDLAVLLPLWILDTQRRNANWNVSYGALLVEFYGSAFLVVNMFIHAYLFFFGITSGKFNLPRITFQEECPHCAQYAADEGLATKAMTKSVGKGPVYSLLGDGAYRDESAESTPRPSAEAQEV
ncbi:hypothetical protein BCR34DRAFT_601948 [Clohesyomyces aquaticus]|uniref:Uncharacterized protein n=1 Tax=Clohesyomyces aquaticus TaxID=1231657 RepID=A0A1Y1ZK89_9PLEO|nr:hypothetical protein BCR34DRAFT_601948 [Clohesyomyces aquaticus]